MENNKNMRIGVVVLLLIVVGVAYLLFTRSSNQDIFIDEEETEFISVSGDENNSVIVNDQIPGATVFFQNLTLEKDGFVVVRSANEDETEGEVVGTLFVEAGSDLNGNVELTSQTVEGGTYYIELYEDSNADGIFDEALDSPVLTAGGRAVRVKIETTENLPEIKG
jgi:hypothetical protein